MTIIKAAITSAKSVFEEQWKEYFICDSLGDDVLMRRGFKRIGSRSTNTRKNDGIITNGSVLSIADGQAVIVVSQGKVIDIAKDPGEHIFYDPDHPGGVGGYVKDVMERISFGGGDLQPRTHRIYYINTKEMMGNRFITPSPVPVMAGDKRFPLSMEASLLCKGVYSFRVENPEKFYRHIAGNIDYIYLKSRIKPQIDSLLLTVLQKILSEKSTEELLRPSDFPGLIIWVRETLKKELSVLTLERFGIGIVSIGIESFFLVDAAMIQELQAHDLLRDPQMAMAHLAGQTAEAMITAARNRDH